MSEGWAGYPAPETGCIADLLYNLVIRGNDLQVSVTTPCLGNDQLGSLRDASGLEGATNRKDRIGFRPRRNRLRRDWNQ